MSQVLNTFLEWFEQLTPSQQAEITDFICPRRRLYDGFYAGPAPHEEGGYYAEQAPRPQSQYCPYCGKKIDLS